MKTKLRCTAYTGQFPSEFAVVVQSHSGRSYSLFTSRQNIEFTEPPGSDYPVECWLAVKIVKANKERNLFLVQLPQSTLENGQFLTVAGDQLSAVPDSCESPLGAHF